MTYRVDRPQVEAIIRGTFPQYTGHMLRVESCESVEVTHTKWRNGTRNHYMACELDGAHIQLTVRDGDEIELRPGACVVCRSIVESREAGLTFYVHPSDVNSIVPPTPVLTQYERIVLRASRKPRASYKDRYELAVNEFAVSLTREQWNTAENSLIAKRLLSSRGAITNYGRNAL
jgi:hypothetical protein